MGYALSFRGPGVVWTHWISSCNALPCLPLPAREAGKKAPEWGQNGNWRTRLTTVTADFDGHLRAGRPSRRFDELGMDYFVTFPPAALLWTEAKARSVLESIQQIWGRSRLRERDRRAHIPFFTPQWVEKRGEGVGEIPTNVKDGLYRDQLAIRHWF
jgi:hypothetical protein